MRKDSLVLMGDFETTVYANQTRTEVWASALVEIGTENVLIFHSIGETFEYLKKLKRSVIVYYHNLKFDGAFWLSYLIKDLKYQQAYYHSDENILVYEWIDKKDMPNNSFRYSISDRGMWYSILIKTGRVFIEIRDSLKLLPFSVKQIGKSFGTAHKKLDMEYKGFRFAGCQITDKEREYIANDVLVVKEALEIMFGEGHNQLTIGACCLAEFKAMYGKNEYDLSFPDLYEIPLDKETYGSQSVGDYIRRSYRGGWCYLVRGKENKIFKNGVTADVNSLYPSVMSSQSGSYYPIGKPKFWKGDFIPEELLEQNNIKEGIQKYYYFIRIKTKFYLRPDMLPFIQIKGSIHYDGTEMLEVSDVYNKKTGKYSRFYRDKEGRVRSADVIMTLTMTDFKLLKEHYELIDFEILDGCYFFCEIGIFDSYIEKYKKIKMTSKGAKRQLAKLFLNNLYGKMASSTDSSFKVAYLKDDGSIGFQQVYENRKKPGYIPIGSAITSYARNFTIRAAQKNYHGVNKSGFIYADTDSIHCDLNPDELKDVPVHDSDFCHWKLESSWDYAKFVRQKTYLEHVIAEDLQEIEEPYLNIKCAGMPEKSKNFFQLSLIPNIKVSRNSYSDEEFKFITRTNTIDDFKIGLTVPGKLMPKRIDGGIVLVDTSYEMRE